MLCLIAGMSHLSWWNLPILCGENRWLLIISLTLLGRNTLNFTKTYNKFDAIPAQLPGLPPPAYPGLHVQVCPSGVLVPTSVGEQSALTSQGYGSMVHSLIPKWGKISRTKHWYSHGRALHTVHYIYYSDSDCFICFHYFICYIHLFRIYLLAFLYNPVAWTLCFIGVIDMCLCLFHICKEYI